MSKPLGELPLKDIGQIINELSAEYDERCMEKHALGEEKYGKGTWLGVDTFEHALDEIVDMGNYVRMSYIKLRLLQMNVAKIQEGTGATANPLAGKEMLGKGSLMHGRPDL